MSVELSVFSRMSPLFVTNNFRENASFPSAASIGTLERSFVEDFIVGDFPFDFLIVVKGGQRAVIQASRASDLNITKKTKRKKPWSVLKKTNSHWKAKLASRLVSTNVNKEKIHVNPNKIMKPMSDKVNLQASFGESWSIPFVFFVLSCFNLCFEIT